MLFWLFFDFFENEKKTGICWKKIEKSRTKFFNLICVKFWALMKFLNFERFSKIFPRKNSWFVRGERKTSFSHHLNFQQKFPWTQAFIERIWRHSQNWQLFFLFFMIRLMERIPKKNSLMSTNYISAQQQRRNSNTCITRRVLFWKHKLAIHFIQSKSLNIQIIFIWSKILWLRKKKRI